MNGVIGMASLLLDTELTVEQQNFVETIRTSGNALLVILNDILDLSRIESGKLELNAQPFSVHQCVESIANLLVAKASEKQIEIALFISESLPPVVVGDEYRLRQVLINLVANAIKFTNHGTTVITADLQEKTEDGYILHFAVSDTGIGIEKDKLPHLFEPFGQVDTTVTRRYDGAGLGLAISRQLCNLMGGTIWVESELGVGSTFHFNIAVEAMSEISLASDQLDTEVLKGRRVLIVDNMPITQQILAHFIQQWGMVPIATDTGEQALVEMNNSASLDVALVDQYLPEMDGISLMSRMRRQTPELPMIILTSDAPRPLVDDNKTAILPKPVKPHELRETLVSILAITPMPEDVKSSTAIIDKRSETHRHLRLLLVEDNVINRKVAERMLTRFGHTVENARNGIEAIEAARVHSYDAIFMDLQMPELDGISTTRKIRKMVDIPRQPYIVAVTAAVSQDDRDRCMAAGMNDFVGKPIQLTTLKDALNRIIDQVEWDTESEGS